MTALRALVLTLLLANVGFFLWTRGIGRDDAGGAATPVVPRLKLASEAPPHPRAAPASGDSASGVAATEAPPASAAAAAQDQSATDDQTAPRLTPAGHCVSVGPFREVAEAVRAASSLRGAGYVPRQRAEQGEVPAGVWVYVARPDDRLAADQVLARLKQAGIDDALEMPGPLDGPVISAGLFSDPRRAQSRYQQVQALGMKPFIVDRKRNADVFWLDVDLKSPDETLNTTDLRNGGNRIMRLETKDCPRQ